jgi:hypothetical protein
MKKKSVWHNFQNTGPQYGTLVHVRINGERGLHNRTDKLTPNSVYFSFKINLKISKGAIRSRKWQNDYMKRALKKLYNIECKKSQRKYQI